MQESGEKIDGLNGELALLRIEKVRKVPPPPTMPCATGYQHDCMLA
jgi:hypothetical protein